MVDELTQDERELACNIKELLTSEENFAGFMRELLESYVFRLAPTRGQAEELLQTLWDIDKRFGISTHSSNPSITMKDLDTISCVVEPVLVMSKEDRVAAYLSNSDWTSLFQYLPGIYKASLLFIKELSPIVAGHDGEELIDRLEDVCNMINQWSENINKYDPYVAAYDYNLEKLRELEAKNSNFTLNLQRIEQGLHGNQKDIYSFIIMPVERVPRYTLFLQVFKKKNLNRDIDGLVERTMENVAEKARQIDLNIADHNNREVLRNISNEIIGAPKDLIEPNRYLVKEGFLVKFCKKLDKPRRVFLFNDSLLYCTILGEEKENKTLIWPKFYFLRGCECHRVADEPLELQVLTNKKSFILQAKNTTEQEEWYLSLNTIIGEENENIMQKHASLIAPLWVQDVKQASCYICNTTFTLFVRRHHCRECGNIICNKCSMGRKILENISEITPQRLCDRCMKGYDPEWKGNSTVMNTNLESKVISHKIVEKVNILDGLKDD